MANSATAVATPDPDLPEGGYDALADRVLAGLRRPTREEAIQRAAQALARCTPISADKLAPSRAASTPSRAAS